MVCPPYREPVGRTVNTKSKVNVNVMAWLSRSFYEATSVPPTQCCVLLLLINILQKCGGVRLMWRGLDFISKLLSSSLRFDRHQIWLFSAQKFRMAVAVIFKTLTFPTCIWVNAGKVRKIQTTVCISAKISCFGGLLAVLYTISPLPFPFRWSKSN